MGSGRFFTSLFVLVTVALYVTAQRPNNSTQAPNNSTQASNNSTRSPNNSTQLPNNSTQSPNNSTQSPNNSTRFPNNSTQSPNMGGYGNMTGGNWTAGNATGGNTTGGNETEIIPCEQLKCSNGTCCQLGGQVCPPMRPCFNRPSECLPFDGNTTSNSTSNSTMSQMGNITVLCPAPSGNATGGGGDGSGLEGFFTQGNCMVNMYNATCGPQCPQDCTNTPKCFAITCTAEQRCFCLPGYVLSRANDTNAGCVMRKDCPK